MSSALLIFFRHPPARRQGVIRFAQKRGLQTAAGHASIDGMDSASPHACFQKALKILARRDHTCVELKRKLQACGYGGPEIAPVIRECRRLNYLNDAQFADTYLKQLQRKGYGIDGITHKLHAKGVAKAIIQDSVAPHATDDRQLEWCRRVLTRKMGQLADNTSMENHAAKLHRFLFNRGFSDHIIRQAIGEKADRRD